MIPDLSWAAAAATATAAPRQSRRRIGAVNRTRRRCTRPAPPLALALHPIVGAPGAGEDGRAAAARPDARPRAQRAQGRLPRRRAPRLGLRVKRLALSRARCALRSSACGSSSISSFVISAARSSTSPVSAHTHTHSLRQKVQSADPCLPESLEAARALGSVLKQNCL